MILTRFRLESLPVIFSKFVTELWPLVSIKISLLLNIFQITYDKISQNFIHIFIWTKSRLGLLPVIFGLFVMELWPLNNVRISFPFNIFRTNGQNLTKLYICIYIDKI